MRSVSGNNRPQQWADPRNPYPAPVPVRLRCLLGSFKATSDRVAFGFSGAPRTLSPRAEAFRDFPIEHGEQHLLAHDAPLLAAGGARTMARRSRTARHPRKKTAPR